MRILQKAFSHLSNLHWWKLDQTEKLKGNGTRFSRKRAFQTPQTGFDVKAFRKFALTSALGDRDKASPLLVP